MRASYFSIPLFFSTPVARNFVEKSAPLVHYSPVDELDPQNLVKEYYQVLYRFAYSLSRADSEAWDLTQQTYYLWVKKGHQLRDRSKVKTWLFTTLYHEFLAGRRKRERFVGEELHEEQLAAPDTSPEAIDELDCSVVQAALLQLKEPYRAPLALFYLQSHSYKQIAEILDIPIGTVMSRISRAKLELRKLIVKSGDSISLRNNPEGKIER